MKTIKNVSKRIIALVLVFVFVATTFAGCKKSENTKANAVDSESRIEKSTTEPVESESVFVTDDNGEPVTDESGSTVTKAVVQSYQTDGSETSKVTVSNSQTETSTNKNAFTNSQSKKPSSSQSSGQCNHSWSAYKWGNTESTYGNKYRTCSKCGKSESWRDCDHSYGAWTIRNMYVKYRTCSKCGWEDEQEGDYRSQCMGTKSEYMDLLRLVNKARREAGLNELIYLDEFQEGANTRAIELTESFSHTRPNRKKCYTAYVNDGKVFSIMNENIVANADTAAQAFGAWMHSEGHKENILAENAEYFVCAKCGDFWVMSLAFKI